MKKRRSTTKNTFHGRRRQGKKVFPQYIGKVQMTREGFIFVIIDGQDDVFVKAAKTRNALDGDTVRVVVTREKSDNKRREGQVVDIIERSGRPFVGIMHFVGAQAWVLMQSRSMPYDIQVDAEEAASLGAQKGMKVSVVVDRWDKGDSSPVGHIVDVLGMPGENDTEMHAILTEFNLPYRFEPEVENAADAISEDITAKDLKGREDFRNVFTFTIDPADAKDFDDALSFRELGNGNYEIGVHIADVSYYVKPGSPVDKEARNRGTSVYLVDRTVPMLPEKLCNKLCSLRPGEDKLTFSTIFEITPKAEVKRSRIVRTVINSNHRLDYDQAQAIIEKESAGELQEPLDELTEAILTLNALALKFKKKRQKAGAIDFDRPEMKVEVDEKGKPVNIYQKVSKEANWLIEEFMLLANRTVAEFVATEGRMNGSASRKAKTFVFRIHDMPDTIKLENLQAFAKGFGYKMDNKLEGRGAAKSINGLLSQAKGKPEYAAFEDIALRSMAKAKYSTENIGHYGLAFAFYTHFTSPIRRYPDTMVHRLLESYLQGGESADRDYYEAECQHASEREQVAADAERASVKYKLVEYMQDKIGETYTGHISGVTEWGIYVEIEPSKVEGMIPLRDIHSDFYEFDEKLYRIKGRATGKVYRLGDEVRIRVKEANLDQKTIDFILLD